MIAIAPTAWGEMERLVASVLALQPLNRPAELIELASLVGEEPDLDEEGRRAWADSIAQTVAKLDD